MVSVNYINRVKKRNIFHFSLGLIFRFYIYSKNCLIVLFANARGANVCYSSSIPLKLALKANKNLTIGERCSIETSFIDLREKVTIGNDVIINFQVTIIRQSHDYNDQNFRTTGYSLEILDWAWLCTQILILPNCKVIGKGAIIGAGSVLNKSINQMEIFSGNPAIFIKNRKQIPEDLFMPSLQGRDFLEFLKARFK